MFPFSCPYTQRPLNNFLPRLLGWVRYGYNRLSFFINNATMVNFGFPNSKLVFPFKAIYSRSCPQYGLTTVNLLAFGNRLATAPPPYQFLQFSIISLRVRQTLTARKSLCFQPKTIRFSYHYLLFYFLSSEK